MLFLFLEVISNFKIIPNYQLQSNKCLSDMRLHGLDIVWCIVLDLNEECYNFTKEFNLQDNVG